MGKAARATGGQLEEGHQAIGMLHHGMWDTPRMARGKAREKVFIPPPSPVRTTPEGETTTVPLAHEELSAKPSCCLSDVQLSTSLLCSLEGLAPFQRLQACLPWWQKHAPPFVIQLIQAGVEPFFKGDHLQFRQHKKSEQEIRLALEVMAEYVKVGAAK